MKDGTSEAGCYLILSGQGCDDYYSFLQTSQHTYSGIAIDDGNEIPYFTIEQIKRKCLKDEFVSKSKSYRFAESSFDEDTAKIVYIGDGKSNILSLL